MYSRSTAYRNIIQQFNDVGPAHIIHGSVSKGRQNMITEAQLDIPPAALVGLAVSLDIFGG